MNTLQVRQQKSTDMRSKTTPSPTLSSFFYVSIAILLKNEVFVKYNNKTEKEKKS